MLVGKDGVDLDFHYLSITDRKVCPEPIPNRVKRLVDMGVQAIQIRDKNLNDQLRYEWLDTLADVRDKLIVNGRFDLAMIFKNKGVHLPEEAIPPKVIHEQISDSMLLGQSIHSAQQARQVNEDVIDYILFGPVYPTESKPSLGKSEIPGLSGLSQVTDVTDVPVFAIGGIDSNRVQPCLSAGAYGVAGIRALMAPEDPLDEWRRIRNYFSP